MKLRMDGALGVLNDGTRAKEIKALCAETGCVQKQQVSAALRRSKLASQR